MGADPIVYCLEQLTDYDQFERLCHDLMACNGYQGIEPLGGMKDKGRDAVHQSAGPDGLRTVLAYSVREDWRTKLDADCRSIQKHGHACDRVAFLSTATFTADERDKAIEHVATTYRWTLDLHGLERLRVLLATNTPVVANHPQIFCPPFFPRAGGISLAVSRDQVLLDFVESDEALGTWIARRLMLAGYGVWAKTLSPIGGASFSETIEALLSNRAFRFLPVFSPASLIDSDFVSRCTLASRQPDVLVPIESQECDVSNLDAKVRGLERIRFHNGWASGLASLLDVLASVNCPKAKEGQSIALRSFIPTSVLVERAETLYSNRFTITDFPSVIQRFKSGVPMAAENIDEIQHRWPHRKVDPQRFLAFVPPPNDLATELNIKPAGGAVWKGVAEIDGINSANLAAELLRKSVNAAFIAKGLKFCPDRKAIYFPEDLLSSDRLYFSKPNGNQSFVGVAGRRKFYRPTNSTYYRYHLSPSTSVNVSPDGGLAITLRVRIHLTDDAGVAFRGRTVISRRKHLCKSWWNDEWFNRVVAIMAFLAGGGDTALIGDNSETAIRIAAVPDHWEVALGIDEAALSIEKTEANREEILAHDHDDDGEQDHA